VRWLQRATHPSNMSCKAINQHLNVPEGQTNTNAAMQHLSADSLISGPVDYNRQTPNRACDNISQPTSQPTNQHTKQSASQLTNQPTTNQTD